MILHFLVPYVIIVDTSGRRISAGGDADHAGEGIGGIRSVGLFDRIITIVRRVLFFYYHVTVILSIVRKMSLA